MGEQCGSFMGADIHWCMVVIYKAPKNTIHIGCMYNYEKKNQANKKHIASLAPLQSTRKCGRQSAKPETHEMKQHPHAKKGQFHPNACLHYQDN